MADYGRAAYNLANDTNKNLSYYKATRLSRSSVIPLLDPLPTSSVTKTSTSSITNAQNIKSVSYPSTIINPLFRYMGDPKRSDYNPETGAYEDNIPERLSVRSYAVTYTPGSSNGYFGYIEIDFDVDGTNLEISVKGNGQSLNYRVLVDEGDGYKTAWSVAPTNIPSDGSTYIINLTFASRKLRRIKYQANGGNFYGVYIGPNDTIYPTARPRGPFTIFMGDSFTEGTGADGWYNGYASTIGRMLGWDYWTSGSGGTGYLNAGTRIKFQDRVQRDVIAHDPEIVILQGGQNDTTFQPNEVEAAAELLFKTVTAGLPNALVIAISNIAIANTTTAVTQTRDAIKAAALRNGIALIDSIDGVTYDFNGNPLSVSMGNWFSGIGNIGSPQATGNRTYYTYSDGGHPSNAGHPYIAERVTGEIQRLLG
jgi:lysophospholipase L1-like esterase